MPNSLGINDNRRVPIRQRSLHPSMVGRLCLASSSSSDPGQSGEISPYCDMNSLYFDDSLYENEMHYHLSQVLDTKELPPDWEVIRIKAENEAEYNSVLDKLYQYSEGRYKMYGVSYDPFEIVIEADPALKYRQFDQDKFLEIEKDDNP